MVDVGVGEQDEVDLADIEAEIERLHVFFGGPPAHPEHAASTRKRTSSVSTKVQEPVTSPAAGERIDACLYSSRLGCSMNPKRAECKRQQAISGG